MAAAPAEGRPAPAAAPSAVSAAAPAAATPAAPAAATPATRDPTVESGNSNFALTISGQINQAMNVVGDGTETVFTFVDNDVSNSRIAFDGSGAFDNGVTAGVTLEVAFSPNNSYDVSQISETSDDFIDVRKAEARVRHDDYGMVMFGKGQGASDDVSEYDLSITAGPIQYSGVADPVGGILLRNANGTLSGTTVGDAFYNFDALGRYNRFEYITPVMLGALQGAASIGSEGRWDAALKWGYDYNDWTGAKLGPFLTLGGIAVSDPSEDGVDYRVNGSASILHEDTGLSFTFSAGTDFAEGRDPYNLYGKLGWNANLFDVGATGFGLDYTYSRDIAAPGDTGQSVGFAAVQTIDGYGIEIYGQVRGFFLSGPSDFKDVVAGTVGTRVKF